MWAKFMSAWLCVAAATDVEVWAEAGPDGDVASLLPELPHAPITAAKATAAIPAAIVLFVCTSNPFVHHLQRGSLSSLVGLYRGAVVVQ